MNTNTYAVILAGGRGERFWPMSTHRHPKQLLALVGRRALLADAVYRMRAIIPEKRILVITSVDLRDAVCHLLPGLPKANVIGEPCGRDTAAAITLAAALIKARNPKAVFCVLTADHVIGDAAVFRRTLKDAFARAAAADVLLTVGLKPVCPSTGFGYIEAGTRLAGPSKTAFYRVRRFVEKPNARIAARYVKAGIGALQSGLESRPARQRHQRFQQAPQGWTMPPERPFPGGQRPDKHARIPIEPAGFYITHRHAGIRLFDKPLYMVKGRS